MARGSDRKRPDFYSRKAKASGRAARSVYKLEEMDQRWRILAKGQRVLDLGCSPGSWLQYAAEKIGPQGQAIGYDLKPVNATLPAHAEARIGDVYELDIEALGTFDVILSDMAPNTTGDRKTDAWRSAGLAENAMLIAQQSLKPGGHFIAKILEGGDVPELIKKLRQYYHKATQTRPKATRKESTEIFLVGLGKRH